MSFGGKAILLGQMNFMLKFGINLQNVKDEQDQSSFVPILSW